MNKSNSLWGKCILAIACMILCAGIYGEEAHAEEVSLKRGEEVFYEGYSTFYYYINNSDYLQKARKYGHFTGYKN